MNRGSYCSRFVVFDEQAQIVLSDNLFDFSEMRSHYRHASLDEVEEFVGQAESIVEVGVFVEAETQFGKLRVCHHLLIGHPGEEAHSIGNFQIHNHLLQNGQHIASTDNHQKAVVQ